VKENYLHFDFLLFNWEFIYFIIDEAILSINSNHLVVFRESFFI